MVENKLLDFGVTAKVVAVLPGSTHTHQPANYKGYMPVKANISHLRGRMVRVEFMSIHAVPKPETYYLDNVSIVARSLGVTTGQ